MSFNVWRRYLVWNFKGYLWYLWNYVEMTHKISPPHIERYNLYTIWEILRTLRHKSSILLETRPWPKTFWCQNEGHAIGIAQNVSHRSWGKLRFGCLLDILSQPRHPSWYIISVSNLSICLSISSFPSPGVPLWREVRPTSLVCCNQDSLSRNHDWY